MGVSVSEWSHAANVTLVRVDLLSVNKTILLGKKKKKKSCMAEVLRQNNENLDLFKDFAQNITETNWISIIRCSQCIIKDIRISSRRL